VCVTIPNLVTLDQTGLTSSRGDSYIGPLFKIGGVSELRETHPSRSNGWCIITKFNPSRPAFQGHTRLLEPTLIDLLPMTSN